MENPVEGEAASESREGCEKTVIRPPSPSTTHFSLLLEVHCHQLTGPSRSSSILARKVEGGEDGEGERLNGLGGRGKGRGRETGEGEGEGGHTHHTAWHTLHNIIYGAANKMDGYLERLAKLDRCPVTVLHGTDDEVLPLDCSYAFKSKVPTAQLKVIENKDHLTIIIGRQKAFARELGRRGKGKGDGERRGRREGEGGRGKGRETGRGRWEGEGESRRESEGGKQKGKGEAEGSWEGEGRSRRESGRRRGSRRGMAVGGPTGPARARPEPGFSRPDAHP
ncbi:hypothetical protein EJ110_NYTH02434 [Nymphaea thermarum]|nr:hypothetical protein EJ110_NYTH02434 [Nymphaea thermarum]